LKKTDTIITRKFRLFWQADAANQQAQLCRFYQDYIAKANDLIRYIFAQKPTFDQQSPTAFQELFQDCGKFAYEILYGPGLNLKTFSRHTRTGLRFKQRTMRMLTNDVYYPIRNHILRINNLEIIIEYLLSLNSTNSEVWLDFLRNGQLPRTECRTLKSNLSQDCFGNPQSMSAVYLKNHLMQLRNLLVKRRPPEQLKKIIPSMGHLKQEVFKHVLKAFDSDTTTLTPKRLLPHLQKKYFKKVKSQCRLKVKRCKQPILISDKDWLSDFIQLIGGSDLQEFQQNYTQTMSNFSRILYSRSDLDVLFEQSWTEVLNSLNNPYYSLYHWVRISARPPKMYSPLQGGEKHFLQQSLEIKIREFLPEFLLTQIPATVSAIQQDIRALQQNLSFILPYPILHSATCSLPMQDNLWRIPETQNTIQFTFSPVYRQKFTFTLLKSKIQKRFREIPESALILSLRKFRPYNWPPRASLSVSRSSNRSNPFRPMWRMSWGST
jgi:hypothetical protein